MARYETAIVTDGTTSVTNRTAQMIQSETLVLVRSAPAFVRLPLYDKMVPEFEGRQSLEDPTIYQQLLSELRTNQLLDTSHANPASFLKIYRELRELGVRNVISIHSNSKLTGGYNSAKIAAEMIREEDPNRDFQVITVDSKSLSAGAGVLVLEAAERVSINKEKAEEIANSLVQNTNRINVLLTAPDANYLIKSGQRRMGFKGLVKAVGAKVMGVTPIFQIQESELKVVELVRAKGVLNQKLVDRVLAVAGDLPIRRALVVQTENYTDAKNVADLFNARSEKGVRVGDREIWPAGVALMVYAGIGARGIGILV